MLKLFKSPSLKRALFTDITRYSNIGLNSIVSTPIAALNMLPSTSYSQSRSLQTGNWIFSEAAVEEQQDKPPNNIDPARDRTRIIPPETSIRYLNSKAYKETYGDDPVWVQYRRNFKGHFTPGITRRTCIRGGMIATGNPCPVCRDEYLVLHYTNVELLKQFLHPQTGEIYDSKTINVCRKKLEELEVALKLAKLHGFLIYDVPFRSYDYREYYPDWKE